MNALSYEERTTRIFNFLYRGEGALLRRYRVPDHMSDDAIRDEINDLVKDINSCIPEGQSSADFDKLIPELRQAVRRRHGAQSWPSAKVMMAAAEDAVEECKRKGGANYGGAEAAHLAAMADWYRRFGTVLPGMGKPSRTAVLIRQGVFTAREARHAGFPLTAEDTEVARNEPMPEVEARKHVEVTAKLRGIAEAFAITAEPFQIAIAALLAGVSETIIEYIRHPEKLITLWGQVRSARNGK